MEVEQPMDMNDKMMLEDQETVEERNELMPDPRRIDPFPREPPLPQLDRHPLQPTLQGPMPGNISAQLLPSQIPNPLVQALGNPLQSSSSGVQSLSIDKKGKKNAKEKKEEVEDKQRKRKAVDWLSDRLVEKIDRDHYMCIVCFKRMSRGYACSHCLEDHQDINSTIKSVLVSAYQNGQRIRDELEVMQEEETDKDKKKQGEKEKEEGVEYDKPFEKPFDKSFDKMYEKQFEKQFEKEDDKLRMNTTEVRNVKTRRKQLRVTEDLKRKLELMSYENKTQLEKKPKKVAEKKRSTEGKRVTMEISKIMATNGIPFAKSEAVWKIVNEVMDCIGELGPQVIEKIRFSARTLKRRYDEQLSQNTGQHQKTQHQPQTQNQPPMQSLASHQNPMIQNQQQRQQQVQPPPPQYQVLGHRQNGIPMGLRSIITDPQQHHQQRTETLVPPPPSQSNMGMCF
ncbi:hypothetical protein EIN_095960 [Entamoeba invadens IP1]|uniref:Uncharacterized protein n=1 Tax=Entamoeba invadens IP1 TaxID=370355 RepID=A0A0A1U0D7_ENTIV|nr:hypothetical protein EIN_095960 [Entamoeba invadens IP1]ELP87339.1 hypothetical protein EIN_095960 [Entamoeba invadens IP1]|eukprot:XP_004254110.1 hypothetical protein EIN_095960 [Entamoeba invadens IP1]